MKKKYFKNCILFIYIIALSFIISGCGFIKSVKQGENDDKDIDKTVIGTVTISINCKTILDNYDKLDKNLQNEKYVPKDGVILKETTFNLYNGDTVFELLKRATKKNDIQLEFTFTPGLNSNYIESINHLYERSCGNLSGWIYKVNNDFASLGCDQYILNDKDSVSWLYTCNLGEDLQKK